MKYLHAAVLAVTALVWTVPAWATPTAAQKCQAGKNVTAGKYAACRQKAEGKLVTAGDMTKYSEAIDKCMLKFTDKWLALETKAAGACPTNLDQASLEYQTRAHADAVAWKVSGDPRFEDNADGTTIDHETGLQWEKKVKRDSSTDFANLHDADNDHLWANLCSVNTSKLCQPSAAAASACAAGVEGDATGCAQCTGGDGTCTYLGGNPTIWEWLVSLNTATFAGHSDWRIAKRSELESIIDLADATPPVVNVAFDGASCGVACADITSAACACTRSNYYWSSTSIAGNPGAAWIVYFNGGRVDGDDKVDIGSVRAVRGGS